jgi:DNA mismatch repair ATPase MutS
VSTHDLALSELEEKDKRVRNMHFREHIEDNKLVFDYVIKEGPCPTSNATYIMRLEGLPIPEGEGLS